MLLGHSFLGLLLDGLDLQLDPPVPFLLFLLCLLFSGCGSDGISGVLGSVSSSPLSSIRSHSFFRLHMLWLLLFGIAYPRISFLTSLRFPFALDAPWQPTLLHVASFLPLQSFVKRHTLTRSNP